MVGGSVDSNEENLAKDEAEELGVGRWTSSSASASVSVSALLYDRPVEGRLEE